MKFPSLVSEIQYSQGFRDAQTRSWTYTPENSMPATPFLSFFFPVVSSMDRRGYELSPLDSVFLSHCFTSLVVAAPLLFGQIKMAETYVMCTELTL